MITRLQIDNFKSLKDIRIGAWPKSLQDTSDEFAPKPVKDDAGFSAFNLVIIPSQKVTPKT